MESVRTGAAMKFVVTGTAVELVRSRASVKNIVTGTAVETVCS